MIVGLRWVACCLFVGLLSLHGAESTRTVKGEELRQRAVHYSRILKSPMMRGIKLPGCRGTHIDEDGIERKCTRDMRTSADKAFNSVAAHMVGLMMQDESLIPVAEEPTVQGTEKIKFQETYKGLPVEGSTAVLEQATDADGHKFFTGFAEGQVEEGVANDVPTTKPTITKEQAYVKAFTHEKTDPTKADYNVTSDCKLFIHLEGDKAFLAWKLSYVVRLNNGNYSRPMYIIDAIRGTTLDHWEGLTNVAYKYKSQGGNAKIGKYFYDDQKYPKLPVQKIGSNCRFESENIAVYHMQSTKTLPSAPYTIPCSTIANDTANGAYSATSDALYFGQGVINMFKDWYNDRTMPANLPKIKMRVHYDKNYENAFWDGKQMTFGDGASRFYPLVSLDVVAHEISHAFTEYTSGLQYKYQSGGMNEAFSDMSGEVAEAYVRGSNDYKIGYDIFKSKDRALRYMSNPPLDGKSIDDANDYYNGLDVHYSSGVYNKGFYLLSKSWGMKKAFSIFVKASKLYWQATSTFDAGLCGLMSAAKDLGLSEDDVACAFDQVNVVCQTKNKCNQGPNPTTSPNPNPDTRPPLTTCIPITYPVTKPPTTPTTQCSGVKVTLGVTRTSGYTGKCYSYYVSMTSGCNFVATLTPQYPKYGGNADLYIKFGSRASQTSYDYKSTNSNSNEKITISRVNAGKLYMSMCATNTFYYVRLGVVYQKVSTLGGDDDHHQELDRSVGKDEVHTIEDLSDDEGEDPKANEILFEMLTEMASKLKR